MFRMGVTQREDLRRREVLRALLGAVTTSSLVGCVGKDGPSVSVCKYGEAEIRESWILSGGDKDKPEPISLLFHLIEVPGRRILADVGCNRFRIFNKDATHFIRPRELLRENGIVPESITDILISHHHVDHAGAIPDFSNARIVVHEWEAARLDPQLKGRHVVTFDKTITLFDGRISMVRVGGHTPGSSLVVIPRAARTIVIGGDACYVNACLERKVPTGVTGNLEESRAFVETYSDPRFDVRLCHDPGVMPGRNGIECAITH
jgi:glyoxylase-like metal-dependent hydrolase (beta-lactamase superfamily II)